MKGVLLQSIKSCPKTTEHLKTTLEGDHFNHQNILQLKRSFQRSELSKKVTFRYFNSSSTQTIIYRHLKSQESLETPNLSSSRSVRSSKSSSRSKDPKNRAPSPEVVRPVNELFAKALKNSTYGLVDEVSEYDRHIAKTFCKMGEETAEQHDVSLIPCIRRHFCHQFPIRLRAIVRSFGTIEILEKIRILLLYFFINRSVPASSSARHYF